MQKMMDGNNQQLVLADAGMGKTSLLVMLKLFHWSGCWPAGIECDLIKLGTDSIHRIEQLENRANKILLLDSLDEDPLAWNRLEQRLLELLDATKNFRRVVISCRTQFFPEGEKDPFARLGKLEIGGFVCPMFYLSPFSPQQVNEYLNKIYPSTLVNKLFGKESPNKIKANNIMKNMQSLRMRPFLLSNIEYLLENQETNWNDYSVYLALVAQWLNREECKIRQYARARGEVTELLPDRHKLLKVCEIVARYLFEKGSRSLTQSEFKEIVRSHPNVELIDELEHGSKSLLNKHSNGDFRFSHYSVQEFITILAWDSELDSSRFTPQMWSFVSCANKAIPDAWIKNIPENLFLDLTTLIKPFLMMDKKLNSYTGHINFNLDQSRGLVEYGDNSIKLKVSADSLYKKLRLDYAKSIDSYNVELRLINGRIVNRRNMDS
ncbi:NACHT domain-containing protein [Pseudomonadota bacterium]